MYSSSGSFLECSGGAGCDVGSLFDGVGSVACGIIGAFAFGSRVPGRGASSGGRDDRSPCDRTAGRVATAAESLASERFAARSGARPSLPTGSEPAS